MKSLEAFFQSEHKMPENRKIVISPRFVYETGQPITWEIKAITEQKNQVLKQNSTSKQEYFGKLCTACVLVPDLQDKKLWESYHAVNAETTLKKMLYMGEYLTLVQEIRTLNGFEKRKIQLKNEAKN